MNLETLPSELVSNIHGFCFGIPFEEQSGDIVIKGYKTSKGKPWNYIETEFYDGKLWRERHYKEGNIHVCKGWYENGQLAHEHPYKEDKKHGVFKEWYENGQLYHENHYKEGKEHGVRKGWHENGQLSHEFHYKEGKRHGVSQGWHKNGHLWYMDYYKNNKPFILIKYMKL